MNLRHARSALLGLGLLVPVALTGASCAAIVGIEEWDPNAGAGGADPTGSGATTTTATGGDPNADKYLCRGAVCQNGCLRCKADGSCRPTCSDGAASLEEPAPDCGGPYCKRCPGGSKCNDPGDCASGVCNQGNCASGSVTPTCID